MKKVQLTRGQYTIIDDEDLDIVQERKWLACKPTGQKGFHAARTTFVNMADVIMRQYLASDECAFHKNGNKLDNRKSNLGIRKRKRRSKKTSKYKGVSLDKRYGRWTAQMALKGKYIHIGSFANEIDAARAYQSAKLEQFNRESPHDEFPVIE